MIDDVRAPAEVLTEMLTDPDLSAELESVFATLFTNLCP
jgi:hypothetical protein